MPNPQLKSIHSTLNKRETSPLFDPIIYRQTIQSSPSLLSKLTLTQRLVAHDGCVNTLSWSEDGSLLLSGSDDTHIALWRYLPGDDKLPIAFKEIAGSTRLVARLATTHTANIFSAQFMPLTNTTIVTCAGDATIKLFDLTRSSQSVTTITLTSDVVTTRVSNYLRQTYDCHTDRVKKVVTTRSDPYLFWTCSEDGTVRQIDTRERVHSCTYQSSCATPLIGFHRPLNAMDIDASGRYVAIGGDYPSVMLFDRRYIKDCVEQFRPEGIKSIDKDSCVSGIAFSKKGQGSRELVASWLNSFVFLFQCDDPHTQSSKQSSHPAGQFEDAPRTTKRQQTPDVYNQEYKPEQTDSTHSSTTLEHIKTGSVSNDMSDSSQWEDMSDSDMDGHYVHSYWSEDDDDFQPTSRQESHSKHISAPSVSYARAYRGHCSLNTVKDVFFMGGRDEYVASGSDDGSVYIWDRQSSKLVSLVYGDSETVNVVQGHPYLPVIAVSGIDSCIKVFEPVSPLVSTVGPGFNCNRVVTSVQRQRMRQYADMIHQHAPAFDMSVSPNAIGDDDLVNARGAELPSTEQRLNQNEDQEHQNNHDSTNEPMSHPLVVDIDDELEELGSSSRSYIPSLIEVFPRNVCTGRHPSLPNELSQCEYVTRSGHKWSGVSSLMEHAEQVVTENETRRSRGYQQQVMRRGLRPGQCHMQ
ncbi:hypothetical protein QVD99_001340 [Batrachochytrium dendrobatidis]|nr:hypothetical protein O5D80_000861 [Batrachochytrium dendrobatidis]KAK5672585.1 hypothetical protein QVD99_001340 [Batrachochytrium dendrobatidis]